MRKKSGQPNEFGIFVKGDTAAAPAPAPAPEPVVEEVEEPAEEVAVEDEAPAWTPKKKRGKK